MKKVLLLLIVLLGSLALTGCTFAPPTINGGNNNQNNSGNNNNNNNNNNFGGNGTTGVIDKNPGDSLLLEGEDYIDHSAMYDGKKFNFDESKWFINNLTEVPLPDPYVYEEDGVYYIYGTCDRNGGKSIDCYTTEDFNTFQRYLDIFTPSGWEDDESPAVYAPELYLFNGVYYLYYSAVDATGRRYNSVVKAKDSPLGNYNSAKNTYSFDYINDGSQPMFKNGNESVLDSTIFVDDDGQMYMYYAKSSDQQHICGVKLINPYTANWSTNKALVRPGYVDSRFSGSQLLSWETYSPYDIAEGPFMLKHDGKYYLTYSVNDCFSRYYNVCYAVSDSPLGNFVKPYTNGQLWTNLLVGVPSIVSTGTDTVSKKWAGFASGPGHHCFFYSGDQLMIAYHQHQNRDWHNTGKYSKRYVAFDYVYFDEDGVPFVNGPTWSLEPLPAIISGYENIATSANVISDNVENDGAVIDNYVVDLSNLKQEAGKEVVLGEGYSYIQLEFDREYEIGGISIYNSGYYDLIIDNENSYIEYINFYNGNIVSYPQFCTDKYVNDGKGFVFPGSAITVEFSNDIVADKVVICIYSDRPTQINEIRVYGR